MTQYEYYITYALECRQKGDINKYNMIMKIANNMSITEAEKEVW